MLTKKPGLIQIIKEAFSKIASIFPKNSFSCGFARISKWLLQQIGLENPILISSSSIPERPGIASPQPSEYRVVSWGLVFLHVLTNGVIRVNHFCAP